MMKCVGGQVKAFNLLFCTASDAESKQWGKKRTDLSCVYMQSKSMKWLQKN